VISNVLKMARHLPRVPHRVSIVYLVPIESRSDLVVEAVFNKRYSKLSNPQELKD
jgi:hypothetical protein